MPPATSRATAGAGPRSKDYAQWHDVARTIAGHVIDRYGADALDFTWSVFNEPDLGPLFWRADWDELQKFYDYTTDAILRAFEDRGYDSSKVFIGGLELGGIFGTNLRLREFLAHCSPRATAEGRLAAERRGGRPPARRQAVAAGRGALPRPRGQGEPVRLHLDPLVQPLGADGRQADPGQGDGPGDRPGLLREALGQLARVVPRLDAAARRGGGRLLPGQRLLPRLVRRRRAPPAPPGRARPALCLRRDDPDGLAAARRISPG